MEDGEVGSSSRRVSQEFTKARNIFEQKSQLEGPNRRISFTSISTNGGVRSVRKVNIIPSVHTCTSVGPKVSMLSNLSVKWVVFIILMFIQLRVDVIKEIKGTGRQ